MEWCFGLQQFEGFGEKVVGAEVARLEGQVQAMLLFWLLVVAGLAWYVDPTQIPLNIVTMTLGWMFGGSTDQFITASPAMRPILLTLLAWLGTLAGTFHVGILISYLYSLIARK